ncbi:hypothetical protein EVAR_89556_1 [Eumeta japonica]|uniref:Uncharacterized protein n=1 Tax=Eumeta variegata TaxID=151549 RepID=A0A4C1YSD7_EUMVA|nr:hypothetical protein EVAR_89556_1 [Eumeta japonica]
MHYPLRGKTPSALLLTSTQAWHDSLDNSLSTRLSFSHNIMNERNSAIERLIKSFMLNPQNGEPYEFRQIEHVHTS